MGNTLSGIDRRGYALPAVAGVNGASAWLQRRQAAASGGGPVA
jgi:hypothetical protein